MVAQSFYPPNHHQSVNVISATQHECATRKAVLSSIFVFLAKVQKAQEFWFSSQLLN